MCSLVGFNGGGWRWHETTVQDRHPLYHLAIQPGAFISFCSFSVSRSLSLIESIRLPRIDHMQWLVTSPISSHCWQSWFDQSVFSCLLEQQLKFFSGPWNATKLLLPT